MRVRRGGFLSRKDAEPACRQTGRKEKVSPLPECCGRGRQAFLLSGTYYFFFAQRRRDLPAVDRRKGIVVRLVRLPEAFATSPVRRGGFLRRRGARLPEALRLGAFARIHSFLEIMDLFYHAKARERLLTDEKSFLARNQVSTPSSEANFLGFK